MFASGCYGHWINWCIRYFGRGDDLPLPFKDTGSAHKVPVSKFFENAKGYLDDPGDGDIVAVHPVSEDKEILSDILAQITEKSHKTIFITPDKNSALLAWNNKFTKVRDEWFAPYLDQIKKDTHNGWGKNWSDMATWERREFLSYYWWPARLSEHNVKTIGDFDYKDHTSLNLFTVRLSGLRDDFAGTITKMLDYLDLKSKRDISELHRIYAIWAELQKHFYKDRLVEGIIESVVNDTYLEWEPLSIIDEATIQMTLRDQHKLDLMCYDLDVFPTNTKSLKTKLEPIQ